MRRPLPLGTKLKSPRPYSATKPCLPSYRSAFHSPMAAPVYLARSSQKATALAAATFRESTLCAMGIFTV